MLRLIPALAALIFSLTTIAQEAENKPAEEPKQEQAAEEQKDSPNVAEKAMENVKETADKVHKEMTASKDYREKYSHNVMGNLSVIDTWIPMKTGLSYGFNKSASSQRVSKLCRLSFSSTPRAISKTFKNLIY